LPDLAFRFADSCSHSRQGPFSGAQNQKLDEDEFRTLIKSICRDEPYVLQVILCKLCQQENPYFVPSVTQLPAETIHALRLHPPLAQVRDFQHPIQNMQQHHALAVALLEDPAVGPGLLETICRAVLSGRKSTSSHINQHEFKQMFENNQMFGWMLRFWLLRGFLSDDHPQFSRLSGLTPPNDILFVDNIEASEAKARRRHQHLAWYFWAFDSDVDQLLAHLQSQYSQITGSPSGQINQGQFEKLVVGIFSQVGIRDQLDMSHLFELFDTDKSGEISRKEIIDGFVEHFHKIPSVFHKIITHFNRKMLEDQHMVAFCSKYNVSVSAFLEKLKALFIARSASLESEVDCHGFCSLWKSLLIDLGIRQISDNIDMEVKHMFHAADSSGNGYIDFAELLYFVSEQCVNLLRKSDDEQRKIAELMRKAARHQEKHGTPKVLGEHSTEQFLNYAWKCFQRLAAGQHQDPVHFECTKEQFALIWDQLKLELGFSDEEPELHIDRVYSQIDMNQNGTISASEMIDGLINHFLPAADVSYSQSKAPSASKSLSKFVSSSSGAGAKIGSISCVRPPASAPPPGIKRPSVAPGSPPHARANPLDAKLLPTVLDAPWCKSFSEEFDSVEEIHIDESDFTAIVTRLFSKKRIPVVSAAALKCMFRIFDTNSNMRLSKSEFLCGFWRVLAFADAVNESSQDREDDEEAGEWEGDYMQYLRLVLVPFAKGQMLSVSRLHEMFREILLLQCAEQGDAVNPSSVLVRLFQRHKLLLQSLAQIEYQIGSDYMHLMQDIAQPGKPVSLDLMLDKISTCSFSLVCALLFWLFFLQGLRVIS
jgi:Ca2+-binding EF-hand superfamily protein